MRINPQLLLYSTLLTAIAGCRGPASTPNGSTAAVPATQEIASPAAKPSVVESVAQPVTRPAIVTLRFNPGSIDAITAGTKTSTCRKGVREFPGNVAIGTDGQRNLNLVILSTTTKKLSELSADDAKSDGSESAEALKSAVKNAYPEIADDDMLTVVSFHVAQ